jgi:hypothetical protein
MGRSGELVVGRVIKTKENTVALRRAKNKHQGTMGMLEEALGPELFT